MTSSLTEATTREILQAAQHVIASGTLQTTEFQSLTVTLRSLRTDLAYAADLPTLADRRSLCVSLFCALRQLTVALLTSDFPRHLDSTDGLNHLALSITLQCLCNLFSLAATNEFSLTAEQVEPLIAAILQNESTQLWILCLDDELPLWRLRLATYSFTLLSHIVRLPYVSVCSAAFFWLTARCMKRIVVATPASTAAAAASDMLKLLQLWYDHCLSVVAGLNLSARLSDSIRELTDLSASLGMMLLLQSEQDSLEKFASPPMKKLAASCLVAHILPAVDSHNSTALKGLISHCVSVLNTCTHETPFCLLKKESDSEPLAPEIRLNFSDRVPALRGCIFVLAEVLSGDSSIHAESDFTVGTSQAPPSSFSSTFTDLLDTHFLEGILSALSDCLVVIDSLLRASLSMLADQNQRRKEPSLMDVMGMFDFSDPASICYAPGLKQDLLRGLLSLVHTHPTLICHFARAKTSRLVINDVRTTGDNPLPESDAFLALLNCTQRDPASPLAVEWAILLLRLLLNPLQSLLNVPPDSRKAISDATSLLSGRLAQLEPCPGQASLKEQLKMRYNLSLS
ncbi:unnamed protein product [Schistocephalus solidus]|uniref:Non-specific serine/threonine protein kinase n=1 Tax=Schistocephalus solidus TaxID=70667 RepID=A0A183SUR8_SCHSO|nr:unnamed protein product [Schistocephalus solidus]